MDIFSIFYYTPAETTPEEEKFFKKSFIFKTEMVFFQRTRKLFEIYETVQNEGVAQVRVLFFCYYSFVSISILRNFYFQTILCVNVVWKR